MSEPPWRVIANSSGRQRFQTIKGKDMATTLKLTHDLIDEIAANVRGGLQYGDAAVLAGVPRTTFYIWAARGKESKSGIHKELIEALQRAYRDYDLMLLDCIKKHSNSR
jgi:hypothetical protein